MSTAGVVTRCKGCDKPYNVDISNVKGDTCQFTCRECETVNTLTKPVSAKNRVSKKIKIEGISIRSKITSIIVLLVLVSLSVVGVVATYKSRQALMAQTEAHLSMITDQKSREYGLVFERIKDEVLSLADYAGRIYSSQDATRDVGFDILMPWTGEGYGSPLLDQQLRSEKLMLQRIGPVIQSIAKQNPFLSLGYMGTESKITVLSDTKVVDTLRGLKAYIPTERPWYQKARQAGETVWTEPYVDANTQKLVVTCATPVYTQSKTLVGVIGFDVLLDTIQKDILSLDIGYNSYAMLIDNKGKALVRPGMNQMDTRWDETYKTEDLLHTDNPHFNAIVDSMVKGQRSVERLELEEGGKLMAYAPLSVIDSSLAVVASQKEIVRPAVNIQYVIAGVWGVVLVISILAGFAVGGGITKPINKLTSVADLISQGKLDLDVLPEDRKDEIGVLTRSFNRLIISLKMAMSR